MADPTPDEDTSEDREARSAEDASAPDAEVATDAGDDEDTPAPAAKRPIDGPEDVARRRAETKARMEAGDIPAKRGPDPAATKARRRRSPMGTASAADPTGTKANRLAASATKKVTRPSKRTGGAAVDAKVARSGNPKKAAAAAEQGRYTAPIPRSQLESPTWVPGLMFAFFAVGMVFVFLTYVVWGGRPLTLGVGLAFILGGILTATQYR